MQATPKELIKRLFGSRTESLEESAKAEGAIKRRRKIKTALELLAALFTYTVCGVSQRGLAAIAQAIGIESISDQAWQKKFLCCDAWLKRLLNQTLVDTRATAKRAKAIVTREIKIVDSSLVVQEGPKGETIRIHMCYNLTAGCMDEISLTDHHTAETFSPFTIERQRIYQADAGLGLGKNLQYIRSGGADALLRVTPNRLRLSEDARGKTKINMVQELDTSKDIVDFSCFVHTEKKKYVEARIVASRLPEDKAWDAVKRKRRNAKKQQRKIKPETLVYAQWVILMTTLDEKYSAQDLLAMYRLRWQVELLFKRIKQFFKVTKLRKATLRHSMAVVLVWLIVWSLTERQALAAQMLIAERDMREGRYSAWVVEGFFAHWIKSSIYALFAFHFNPAADWPAAWRRLRNH
jgi:hypothetical protein